MKFLVALALILMSINAATAGSVARKEDESERGSAIERLGVQVNLLQDDDIIKYCNVNVKLEDIKRFRIHDGMTNRDVYTFDEWDFSKGDKDGKSERGYWGTCSIDYLNLGCFKYGWQHADGGTCVINQNCKRCKSDHYNVLEICRADKGVKIGLYDNNYARETDDHVVIEMLEDFDAKFELPDVKSNGKNAPEEKNCLRIENLERDITTDQYKMTFHYRNGKLNKGVSCLKIVYEL